MKQIIASFLLLTFFISCNSDQQNNVDYTTQNEKEILEYLAKNNIKAQRTASGLYYTINEIGTGANPTENSNVTVTYKGYFTNDKIFDSSADGISFGLHQVIKGWTQGIPLFKVGGSGKLFIPAHLGYGSSANGPIPAGSVLIFDVKLISIN